MTIVQFNVLEAVIRVEKLRLIIAIAELSCQYFGRNDDKQHRRLH